MMKREPKRSASWTRGGSSTQQSGSGTPGGAARWCRRHMAMAGAARAIVSLAARDRRALLILFLQATHLARELLAYSVTYGVRFNWNLFRCVVDWSALAMLVTLFKFQPTGRWSAVTGVNLRARTREHTHK